MSPLTDILNRRILMSLAGSRSFERGEDYWASDRVRLLTDDGAMVKAKVRGTRSYQVKLWIENGSLGYDCSCPVGDSGDFCKHCVAVGLAWLDGQKIGIDRPSVTMEDVRVYLTKQEKEVLIELILSQAEEYDQLRDQLLMKAAKAEAKDLDLNVFRHAVDNAIETDWFIDYRNMHDYAAGIEKAIGSLEDLLNEGYGAEAMELLEYALARAESAMENVDDSDGDMGTILERLQDLHLRACAEAKPDPEALAEKLFKWELRTEWDVLYGAAQTYADVLGERGLAVYRKLAEAEWKKLPSLSPGQDRLAYSGKRYRITSIMETLARQSGDLEALVSVMSRDLSNPYDFLQIAAVYQEAGLHDKALEWAEKGVKAFPKRPDSRLRTFLADEYHRRARHDEMMALIWAEFQDRPSVQRYQQLSEYAGKTKQRPIWQEKALQFIRKKADRVRSDSSLLVEIFLWQNDIETAWREACEGGCSDHLWMELAAKREKDYPEDALGIYQRRVEPMIQLTNDLAYEEAVSLLKRIQRLMSGLGKDREFAEYLQRTRLEYKRKRNFIKLLDKSDLFRRST